MTIPTESSSREITILKTFRAPIDRVYAALTDSSQISSWWGPDGYSAPKVESDPHSGGELTILMCGPEDFREEIHAKYVEVSAPSYIEVESEVFDGKGNLLIQSRHKFTLKDLGNVTEVIFNATATVYGPNRHIPLAGMYPGWNQSLQKLDDLIEVRLDRTIVIGRLISATASRVFQAWTNPDHLSRWWGPDGFTVTTRSFSATPGGLWDFIFHGPDGSNYENQIIFEQLIEPCLVVYSHSSPKSSDANFKSIVLIDEMLDKTVVSMRLVFDSKQKLEENIARFNSIDGANQTLARLDGYLKPVVS